MFGQAEETASPLPFQVIGLPSRELRRRLSGLEIDHFPVVVIDTPPGDAQIITSALELAWVVVIPVRPSVSDVARAWSTLRMAADVGTPALVVLSQCRARTRLLEDSRSALLEGGARVARVEIPAREVIAGAYGGPVPEILVELGGKLLKEMQRMARKGTR